MKKIYTLIVLTLLTATILNSQNYVLDFDGVDDYVKINYSANLFPATITLAAWINPSATPSSSYIISTKQMGGYSLGFNIGPNGTNPDGISARCRIGATYYNIYGTSDISLNVWSHVALTYDGNEFKIFVNGVMEDSLSVSGTLTPSSSPLYFGAESAGNLPANASYYDGLMDEVAIFNTHLSAIEINELMTYQINSGHSKWSNIIGYWKMNEGINSSTVDGSGNSNAGVLTNGTKWLQETISPLVKSISMINFFETWTGNGTAYRLPDPAGITYNQNTNSLFIVDSEINEYDSIGGPIDRKVLNTSLDGTTVIDTLRLNNHEPTGITFDPNEELYFITNDDHQDISKYNKNWAFIEKKSTVTGTGSYCSGCDPEGVTCDPSSNKLYIADGFSGKILVYDYNLDKITDFNIKDRVNDPEGIAFHPISKTLFIIDGGAKRIYEYTTNGIYIAEYDLSGFSTVPITGQGLTFAPASDDYCNYSLYISDGMIDNNDGESISKNGRIFEAKIDEDLSIVERRSAILLDGVNDYLKADYNANMYHTTITLAAWINPSATPSNSYIISTKHGGGYSLGFNIGQGTNPNKISARCKIGTNYYNIEGTSTIPLNTWSHVALTYDGSTFKIYVDGGLDNSSTVVGTLVPSLSPLYIGAESDGNIPQNGTYFEGLIDEVAILNTALNASEIGDLKTNQLESSHPKWGNLKGYWKLNEGIGNTASDESGNNNVATLTNEAEWECNGNNPIFARHASKPKVDDNKSEFTVYPNPTNGDFYIDLGDKYETISVSIKDLVGRTIQSINYTDREKLHLQLNDQAAGIYLVSINIGKEIHSFKLLKE